MTCPTTRPVALVTGGSRGIGRAIATDLARDHHVIIGGRDLATTSAVADSLPSAGVFVADLADAEATTRACTELTSTHPRLAVLVHSAGIADSGTVAHADRALWQRLFEVNVVAVADLTRQLLPSLRPADHDQRGGQIVMINSGAGFTSSPGGGPYAASKFALRALTDALREEERGLVRVTSIHPGRTDSDMQRDLQHHLGRPYEASEHLTAESVAATVRLAIDASDEAMIETLSIRPIFKA